MKSRYDKLVDTIIDKLLASNKNVNTKLILQAYELAYKAHQGVFRSSGEPYIIHPISVANILADMKVDDITIVASLLHDVVEDTDISLFEIEEKFGKAVADIVDGVTKISEINFESFEHKQAENYRKLIISMIKDFRVIIIKFADRLHNMRTINFMTADKQKKKAEETIGIYAPLAFRLGMYNIKSELEDLSFEILDPENYNKIKDWISVSVLKLNADIEELKPSLTNKLKTYDLKATVSGRVKHFYSIFRKLKTRKDNLDQIMDLIALRVIVETKDECYRALNVIHNFFRPVPEMMSDFIASPKPNGYQSIHSKVLFKDRIIEIQVRTKKMHEIAEYGLAAHWKYKKENEKKYEKPQNSDPIDNYIDKIKSVFSNSFGSEDPKEVLEELKLNLVSDEIFVFTPKRELVILPKGSTSIDFAYKIHDAIGSECIAAKRFGHIIPLNTKLVNGDVIKIITSKKHHPSYDWLKIAVSAKARSAIKEYFKKDQFKRTVDLGVEILNTELEKLKIKLDEKVLIDSLETFGFTNTEEAYYEIGQGNIKPLSFLRKIIPEEKHSLFNKFIGLVKFKKDKKNIAISHIGNSGMTFGDCCNPLPGDAILGEIMPGKGIKIHRADCVEFENVADDKIIAVKWKSNGSDFFRVKIQILAEDRRNLLHDILEVINSAKINLLSVNINTEETLATGELTAEVQALSQYTKLRKKIASVNGVLSVGRVRKNKKS